MSLKPAYFVKEAADNMRRNLLMALAAALAVAISLTLLGSVLLLFRVVKNVTQRWEGNVLINVFLKEDATSAQITAARESIQGYREVKDVKFVSKKDAYDEFRQMFKDQPSLLENVTPDSLPPSFRISLNDPRTLPQVSDRMRQLAGVDEVVSDRDLVKKVQTILRIISLVVFGAAVVLLTAAVVLISNTIRLAIFARRKEIAIMKLVGATNWFIRWPFMLEGLVQGVVGALGAIFILFLLQEFVIKALTRHVPFLPLGIPNSWMALTFGLLAIIGGLIAVGGTALALRRHLEV